MMPRTFRFASFTLDRGKHRLAGPSGKIDLRPKSFEVLMFIVERAGRVVTKAELIEAVWPQVIVTDESLTRCISDVRIALQDDQRTIIRTVARLGYMLDVPVTVDEAVAQPSTPAPVATDDAGQDRGEEGRRPATALYIDIREDVASLTQNNDEMALTRYEGVLACASEVFRRFGARVQVAPGEGVVGLFGVPSAQEDHAVRACHAALECHRAVARREAQPGALPGVCLGIGIASGNIAFRPLAGLPEQAWTAMGATVDHARHLGRAAAPGTTLIADHTRQLAEGQVIVSVVAAGSVEGASRLEQCVPSATRFKAALSRGLTPFVGRATELSQLNQAGRLATGGHGQVVAIIGEAGVGKSRLVHEFVGTLERRQDWQVLDCTAVSYGKATSYLPVINLLRGYFRIDAVDGIDDIQHKVTTRLRTLDAALESAVPAVLALLDVPVGDALWAKLDPGERRRRTLDAIKLLLLREARARPLLLVVEDLHWIDTESQALLDGLVDSLGAAHLLLLATYRPEYRHGWAGKSSYGHLRLDALPASNTAEMLDALLGTDPGLAHLKQLLVRRGIPFFIEEAVRTLADGQALKGEPGAYHLAQPVDAIRIPPTVQAMLAARIDRLAPKDKRILETAAVVGKNIPLALLAIVTEEPAETLQAAFDRLQAAELVHQTGLHPEVEYAFRHALIHEVAYAGLLQARLTELHARIAAAIETLYRDRISEHTERLAHHAHRGELHEKAVHYLRQSGLRAAGRSALTDAQHWLEQALDVNNRLPESTATLERGLDIRLELRGVLYQRGEARALLGRLREAHALAERLGDERRRCRVAAFMTSIHTMLGDLNEAVAIGERTLASARRLDDLELRINASNYLVQAHYYRGDYGKVIDLASDSLALWPDDWAHKYHTGNPAPASVFNRAFIATSLAQLGRFPEAAQHEAEALKLAEPTQNAFTIAMAHVPAPTLYTLRGDWEKARLRMERYTAVARTGNIIGLLSTALSASAWILAELGEQNEAASRIAEADLLLERQAANGIGTLSWAYYALGRASLRLGRIEEARRRADCALAVSTSQFGFTAHALHLLGDIASRPDGFDADGGERYFQQALALAEPRGMRPLIAGCHAGLSTLYQRWGKPGPAQEHQALAARMQGEILP